MNYYVIDKTLRLNNLVNAVAFEDSTFLSTEEIKKVLVTAKTEEDWMVEAKLPCLVEVIKGDVVVKVSSRPEDNAKYTHVKISKEINKTEFGIPHFNYIKIEIDGTIMYTRRTSYGSAFVLYDDTEKANIPLSLKKHCNGHNGSNRELSQLFRKKNPGSKHEIDLVRETVQIKKELRGELSNGASFTDQQIMDLFKKYMSTMFMDIERKYSDELMRRYMRIRIEAVIKSEFFSIICIRNYASRASIIGKCQFVKINENFGYLQMAKNSGALIDLLTSLKKGNFTYYSKYPFTSFPYQSLAVEPDAEGGAIVSIGTDLQLLVSKTETDENEIVVLVNSFDGEGVNCYNGQKLGRVVWESKRTPPMVVFKNTGATKEDVVDAVETAFKKHQFATGAANDNFRKMLHLGFDSDAYSIDNYSFYSSGCTESHMSRAVLADKVLSMC